MGSTAFGSRQMRKDATLVLSRGSSKIIAVNVVGSEVYTLATGKY